MRAMLTVAAIGVIGVACKAPPKNAEESPAAMPWPDSVLDLLPQLAERAKRVALEHDAVELAAQKTQRERAARPAARKRYAEELQRLMANDGISSIVRVEGAQNETLFLKLNVCRDIDLNAIVNSDKFENVQRELRFDRVRCVGSFGDGATVTYDWTKQ